MRKVTALFMAIIMLFTLLPNEKAYAATAKEIQEFCNGTDFFVAEDGTEYFINSDDEDKLYRITRTGVELVLDEHIVLLVYLNTMAYLVAYRDTKCVLLKFDTQKISYEKIYDFKCSVSNIALKGNNLYFINNENAQVLNLENLTVENVSEKSVDTLYFDQSATLKLIENTCVPSDFTGSKDERTQRSASKNVTSYTPRLTAPAKDNPYYTTLNIFHNSGYGMAPNIGNCTCYAFGRSYENLGTEPKLSHGNAGEWYDYNKKYGYYSYGATPTLGAVCVWKSSGAGHVAVVEVIDGNTVTTSESGWESFYFKTVTRNASNSNLSASSYYSFQGFIYVLGSKEYSEGTPGKPTLKNFSLAYESGATIVFNWEDTISTTHYNLYIDKKITDDTWDIDYLYWHYAESGLSTTLDDGIYRVLVQATNSNIVTDDGSWAYTNSDYITFAVGYDEFYEGKPSKPTLKNFSLAYESGATIVFNWEDTISTTHYNLYIDKKKTDDTWDIDYLYWHYAESGLSTTLDDGIYRVLVQATNSNIVTDDGSWAYTNSDYITFTVGYHEHVAGEFLFYEELHPHYRCYYCTLCESKWVDYTSSTYLEECLECQRPQKPSIVGLENTYSESDTITFDWTTCNNTTHTNFWLWKMNEENEWELVEKVNYAEKGLKRILAAGNYRTSVVATNSKYFEEDGSSWLWNESDYIYFTVSHTYVDTVISSTCAEQGHTIHKCTSCGDSYKDNYTAALGHNYSYKVTTTPTASATGMLTGTCSRCSDTTTVTLPKLNTTEYTYSVVKAATCTATGTGRYTWNTTAYGSFYFDITLDKFAHDYRATVTAPTCTAQGYTTHTCSECGDSYKDSYTAALGHAYSYKATTAPTTSATGKLTGTCSRCSGTTTVTLPKLNTTDYTYSVIKAATCTATGTGRYTWKMTTYGSFYFDVTIAKTPHDYKAVVTNPTCEAQGYTTHTCTKCQNSYKDSYKDALGHDYSYKVTTTPTTSATGKLTGTCTRCTSKPTVTLPKLNTTDYTYKVTKEATCTATGTGRYTWKTTTYGTFYFDVTIAKNPHDYKATITAPTCTAQGYTTHMCSVCGDTYKDTYTDTLGHNYSYKVTTTPTISAIGKLTGTCSRCSSTTTVALPKLNTTDYSYSVVNTATCTATGTGRYTWKTTTYGNFYFDVTIDKTPHDYKATVTAPTCTAQGYTTHTCSTCGNNYVDSYVAALGHAESDWIVDSNATCTASGSKHTQCTRCGVTMQTSVILATGHNESEWIVDKNATCTASGSKHTECLICGTTLKTEAIPTAGHSHQEYVTAPTCTERGYTTHICDNCNDSYIDSYVNALGHEWDAGTISQEPTCTHAGIKLFNCNRCSETKTESVEAAGHSYTDNITAATCTEGGFTTHTCGSCGDSYTTDETAALGHAWDDGKVTTEPTATEAGVMTYTCTREGCGETKTEEIPALGEDPDVPCDGGADCPSAHFTDIHATDWYHEAVDFAVENGLFGGMSANTFEPNTAMTRAMLVTVLWRYAGEPAEGENTFTDVPAGQWYTDAVAWAAFNNIVGGVGDNKFDPNGNITREQMATILYRYANGQDIDTSARADLSAFPDAGSVSSYANDPICWAVAEGLINGSDGKLMPQGNATRAQVATILMRFIENVVSK